MYPLSLHEWQVAWQWQMSCVQQKSLWPGPTRRLDAPIARTQLHLPESITAVQCSSECWRQKLSLFQISKLVGLYFVCMVAIQCWKRVRIYTETCFRPSSVAAGEGTSSSIYLWPSEREIRPKEPERFRLIVLFHFFQIIKKHLFRKLRR